jgi:hypothetical protein
VAGRWSQCRRVRQTGHTVRVPALAPGRESPGRAAAGPGRGVLRSTEALAGRRRGRRPQVSAGLKAAAAAVGGPGRARSRVSRPGPGPGTVTDRLNSTYAIDPQAVTVSGQSQSVSRDRDRARHSR